MKTSLSVVVFLLAPCLTSPAIVAQSTGLPAPRVFRSAGLGGGGAFYHATFNPRNLRELWMPTDMGELFHTTDGGASWSYPDMAMFQATFESKVEWTNIAGTIYAHEYNGLPVKSTDGGNTWTKLQGWGYFTLGPCRQLRAHPNNADIVFGASANAIALSRDGGRTFVKIWDRRQAPVLWLAGLFAEGNNLWLGTNDGLLVSRNGGATWAASTATGLPAGTVISSFAGGRQGGQVRFWVTLAASQSNGYFANDVGRFRDFRGFYRLADGASQWTNLTASLPANHFGDTSRKGNLRTLRDYQSRPTT